MRFRSFAILAMVSAASTFAYAQFDGPDFSRSPSGRLRSPQEAAAARAAHDHRKQQDAKFEEFRRRARASGSSGSLVREDSSKIIKGFRKPTPSELSDNEVLRNDQAAGVFTFLSRNRCLSQSSDKKQAALDEIVCFDPPPGNGLQFSFRRQDYVPGSRSDLGLSQGWFVGGGLATQTILTDLGDVPIADVDLKSTDLQYLMDFVPALTLEEANKQRHGLGNGISHNGRNFFNVVKAAVNHTYLLRSIAYRGEMITVVDTGKTKVKLNALKDDKRLDVIVAFRVLRIDNDGDVRILWQLLRTSESPRLDFPVKVVDGSKVTTVYTVSN